MNNITSCHIKAKFALCSQVYDLKPLRKYIFHFTTWYCIVYRDVKWWDKITLIMLRLNRMDVRHLERSVVVFMTISTFKQYFVCHITSYQRHIKSRGISMLKQYTYHNHCQTKIVSKITHYIPSKTRRTSHSVNKKVWRIASISICSSRYKIWFHQIISISLAAKHYRMIQLPSRFPLQLESDIENYMHHTFRCFSPTGINSPQS